MAHLNLEAYTCMHECLRRHALRLQTGANVIVLAPLVEAANYALCCVYSLWPLAAGFVKNTAHLSEASLAGGTFFKEKCQWTHASVYFDWSQHCNRHPIDLQPALQPPSGIKKVHDKDHSL